MKKKTVALLLAVVLVLGAVVGGTLAYLMDTTSSVVNTFAAGDVDIELSETTGNSYKMVPGATITKDPKVTVEANSEKCFVFVKLEKSTNFDTFMTYEMADGWTELTGVTGVYYREVDASAQEQTFAVIKGNAVSVNSDVTKTQMDELTEKTQPTLTVTAYACQYYKANDTAFTVAEAWNQVNGTKAN